MFNELEEIKLGLKNLANNKEYQEYKSKFDEPTQFLMDENEISKIKIAYLINKYGQLRYNFEEYVRKLEMKLLIFGSLSLVLIILNFILLIIK